MLSPYMYADKGKKVHDGSSIVNKQLLSKCYISKTSGLPDDQGSKWICITLLIGNIGTRYWLSKSNSKQCPGVSLSLPLVFGQLFGMAFIMGLWSSAFSSHCIMRRARMGLTSLPSWFIIFVDSESNPEGELIGNVNTWMESTITLCDLPWN